ncbi:MAG: hypothetical protein WCK02_13910 [Bacteroidota bacterium]
MNPLLFISVAVGLGKLFVNSFSGDNELNNISYEHIFDDFMRKHFKKTNVGAMKSQITKSINEIIPYCKSFKIGKTGSPENRNRQHIEYNDMFLLCESNDDEFISVIEHYYNLKYIDHPKNDNKNIGSACKSKSMNGKHYLYVVIR